MLEEAKLLGIPVLGVDINRSEGRFTVERVGISPRRPEGRWAIRIGLRQVAHVGDELADAILWARRGEHRQSGRTTRTFTSLADFCQRLRPAGPDLAGGGVAGARRRVRRPAPHADRRHRLWQLREFWPLIGADGSEASAEEATDTAATRSNCRSTGASGSTTRDLLDGMPRPAQR